MSDKWIHVVQLGLMIGGGIACLALGQIPIGSVLLGAAAGNAMPQNMITTYRKPKGE